MVACAAEAVGEQHLCQPPAAMGPVHRELVDESTALVVDPGEAGTDDSGALVLDDAEHPRLEAGAVDDAGSPLLVRLALTA